jgi:malate/lactate dehydrogenase
MSPRVAIVGAGGGVGSSVAFNLLLRAEPYAVDLVDGRSGMSVSHEMDLQQVVAAGATGAVRVVDLRAIATADVVVVSASAPLTVNRSRLVYLRDNAAIVASVVAALGPDPTAWPGVLLVVTNPVDVLATWLVRRFGLEAARRRLHRQLQPAAAHRGRRRARRAAGLRRRVGPGRARRRVRAAVQPHPRRRRAGRAR